MATCIICDTIQERDVGLICPDCQEKAAALPRRRTPFKLVKKHRIYSSKPRIIYYANRKTIR